MHFYSRFVSPKDTVLDYEFLEHLQNVFVVLGRSGRNSDMLEPEKSSQAMTVRVKATFQSSKLERLQFESRYEPKII